MFVVTAFILQLQNNRMAVPMGLLTLQNFRIFVLLGRSILYSISDHWNDMNYCTQAQCSPFLVNKLAATHIYTTNHQLASDLTLPDNVNAVGEQSLTTLTLHLMIMFYVKHSCIYHTVQCLNGCLSLQ